MAFILVALTISLIILSEVIGRREERRLNATKKKKRTGIFLQPEKTIKAVGDKERRLYHPSHTWVSPAEDDFFYVGYDSFIPDLFTRDVYLSHLPEPGSEIHQGEKSWDIGISDKKVSQYAPVSGKVVKVNPAVMSDSPLPSGMLEKSWILKVDTKNISSERHNLVSHTQAMHINRMLSDELKWTAMHGHYLNDGGVLDADYIIQMSPKKWKIIVEKFFQISEK